MSTDHQQIQIMILSMSKEMYKIKSGKNNLLKKCPKCLSLIIQRLLFIIDKIFFFRLCLFIQKMMNNGLAKNGSISCSQF